MYLFDAQKSKWNRITGENGLQQISKRRNHAAAIMGDRMIVYGGIDSNGKYLSDVWEFFIKKKKWFKCHTRLAEKV